MCMSVLIISKENKMQKQTKKQFESFHDHKERNAWMRKMKKPYRITARQNSYGDWIGEWNIQSANLPEKIKIMKEIKDLEEMRTQEIRKGWESIEA